MGTIVETFMNSNADAMTGAVRMDRNVHTVCERWGTQEIALNIPSGYGDARGALVGFFKDKIVTNESPAIAPIVKQLWKNRVQIEE